jgi:hypothetical protein
MSATSARHREERLHCADSRPSALTLERGGSTAKLSFVTRTPAARALFNHPPAEAAQAAPECKQCGCRQNMNCRRCNAVYSSKLSALEGSPLSCLASTENVCRSACVMQQLEDIVYNILGLSLCSKH